MAPSSEAGDGYAPVSGPDAASPPDPAWRLTPRTNASVVVALLLASGAAIAVAPALMPASYSWFADTVSESAGQGVEGAWLARLGLLLYGFAVLLLAGVAKPRWGQWGTLLHRAFGIAMIAAAAFAARPWDPALPFDAFEDLLHSIAASAMGVAFAGGVLAVAVRRGRSPGLIRLADVAAVAASVLLPLAMFNVASLTGVLQRILFVIGYGWYGLEAGRTARSETQTRCPTPGDTLAARRVEEHEMRPVMTGATGRHGRRRPGRWRAAHSRLAVRQQARGSADGGRVRSLQRGHRL